MLRVQGSTFRVPGLGSGFRLKGLGFRDWGSGFRVQGEKFSMTQIAQSGFCLSGGLGFRP